MERIHVLIDKLAEQKKNNAPAAQMLFTVQLLHNELMKSENKNTSLGTAKVAVIMPGNSVAYSGKLNEIKEALLKEPPQRVEVRKPVADEAPKEKKEASQPPVYNKILPAEHNTKEEVENVPVNQEQHHLPFNAMEETPTLLHQKRKELHEVIGGKNESLNDRLRQDKKELAHKLKDSPVKDLRKAIGVNDRFTFVQELFRGDEAMYERTIKTVNGFNILPEAEYWINRELKVKLGWNDSNEAVQHFYQLVRRRFS